VNLSGKTAVITGAGSGIGRATALLLARQGVQVALLDLDRAGLECTAAEIDTLSDLRAIAIEVDVSSPDGIARAFTAIQKQFGRLDYGVNNAGILGAQEKASDMTLDAMRRVFDVNVFGLFDCMKHELAIMLPQKRGAIVNVSSVAGLVGARRQSAYSGSKHAVIGLTKCAALDHARAGIRVNAVCPGLVPTPLASVLVENSGAGIAGNAHPIGRLGRTSEIADAIAWLLSDNSSFVTGAALPVDGGYTAT
jgi:NAD(P)-dependent dehydrogenase (short-subunit alcohol dehydrogenase family)